jgi:hypothetical protein
MGILLSQKVVLSSVRDVVCYIRANKLDLFSPQQTEYLIEKYGGDKIGKPSFADDAKTWVENRYCKNVTFS